MLDPTLPMNSSAGARPRLLVLSHVLPFPGHSGQQQRVANTLRAVRDRFHVTFASVAPRGQEARMRHELRNWCDEVLLLPSEYDRSRLANLLHQIRAKCFALRTGLKTSNYVIGQLELSPARVLSLVENRPYDLALIEYFHAADAATALRQRGVPCVLDTHNVLWQAYDRQLNDVAWTPAWWKRTALRRYQKAEESAWRQFDGLIAINTGEANYMRSRVPSDLPLFQACMGLDLSVWPYSWEPAQPPRVGYYGGLGSGHNAREALRCYQQIMPRVWMTSPKAELWIIGSKPPPEILALKQDPRVRVTGFVERAQDVLKSLSVCLCPWTGTYGFRSRLVEVMALGVPVVASPDAAYGMEFQHGHGIFFEENDERMALAATQLLADATFSRAQSEAARKSVEAHYGFTATYGRMADELFTFATRGTASSTQQASV